MTELSYKTASDFGLELTKLYNEISSEGNTAISPISVFICVAMLKHGANGVTKQELEKALSISAGSHGEEAQHVSKRLKDSSDDLFTMTTANGLFLQENFQPLEAYVQHLKESFEAHVKSVKFGTAEGETVVNQWVEEQTNGKIKDLVKGTTPDTVMALINAVYMKGKWMQEFKKEGTVDGDFYLSNGSTVKTKLMRQNSNFKYISCKKDKFALAFLPYRANSAENAWEMGILLPERGLNPADFLKFLKYDSLKKLRSDSKSENLDIILPKVKIESTIDLIPMFEKLGVKSAFADTADFSGICDNEATQVSDILQKCFVDIDEEGTEAAAATVVMMMRCAMMHNRNEPIRFHVTSSYLYFIHQPESGLVLFSGVVRNPVP